MKYLLIIVLIVLSILVVIPPLHYHYVYPTAGDDTASHLIYFQNIDTQQPLYYGQYLIGKIVNALPFDPKVTFLWFHFIVLALTLWVIGISVSLAINYLAGILSVFAVIGISSFMPLYHWGQIFDIVGIAILLPIALLCLHKMDKGLWWKVGAIISLIAFTLFHVNGKYMIALAPMVILYEVARAVVTRKRLELGQKMKEYRFLVYAGLLGVILWALYLIGYSPDPGRLWMDGSILMVVFLCCVVGLYLNRQKILVSLGVVALVIGLAIPNLALWMQNNSAMKDVDKEAIAYLNDLNGYTYTASTQVAQWIYGLYVSKNFQDYILVKYKEKPMPIQADYVIARTVPMTPASAIGNMYFLNQSRADITDDLGGYGYRLLQTFDEGEKDRVTKYPIVVSVYGK